MNVKIDNKDKTALTPMMAQYVEISQANPDTLLFYRMGDFYELFFDDAETASKVLGIALTHRGTYLGKPIPMAGVPHHSATDYLHKLIEAGYKVSICEQIEDPAEAKKRGAKAVVRREVRRIATPGTLTEDKLLRAGKSNYLLAIMPDSSAETPHFGLAWTDISTGEFQFTSVADDALSGELGRLQPCEILIPETLDTDSYLARFIKNLGIAISPLPPEAFDSEKAKQRLADVYDMPDADLLSSHHRVELSVAGAILSYIDKTQLGAKPPLKIPEHCQAEHHLSLDAATLGNLEILKTTSGERKGSLLDVIDKCVSGPGSRKIALWLGAPLVDTKIIQFRHDAVQYLFENLELRNDLQKALGRSPDILRALSSLSLGRGEPRDLAAIRDGLLTTQTIHKALSNKEAPAASTLPQLIDEIAHNLTFNDNQLRAQLENGLGETLPSLKRDGGFIRSGFNAELDEARLLRDDSRKLIAALQARYIEDTGIKALKIKHNNVLGYFIEVPSKAGETILSEARENAQAYIHRQSMANAHRFTTRALDDLQVKILAANDQALAFELALFDQLTDAVLEQTSTLQVIADALAALDCYAALALVADRENWVRPEVNNSLDFDLKKARHPVVEAAVRREGQHNFVANDCYLTADQPDKGRIMLLTGPNMAGKSTYLRQNALVVILAQMGSFVPAEKALIGVIDKVFSRVGASDDLARGQSTFMVEMVETAAILNQSTSRSLVILDEIGRGTATFDGLSIAWACIEHLHQVNHCRCLFATHFHELTALEKKLDRLNNATIKVREWKQDVVFLHEVISGVAAGSYGIQVGRLAGLPPEVIKRARDVLSQLEKEERMSLIERMIDDLPLFGHRPQGPAKADDAKQMFIEGLGRLDVDNMTPRQALEQLFGLVSEARQLNDEA